MIYCTSEWGQEFGKVRGIFQIGNRKFKKDCKIYEKIVRASKVSIKKNSKNLSRVENFVKRLESICFKLLIRIERSSLEIIRFVEKFLKFLGRNSSVIGLFIDFLTSGLSCVQNCWGFILCCSGGLPSFVFICWIIGGIVEIFVL